MTREASAQVRAKIEKSFASQGLMSTLDASVLQISEGQVVLQMPITKAAGQQHGFAHAGASFALGDSAAGYAALSLMPLEAEVLTVEMKINLLAPAAGDMLIATGTVVKPGRRLIVTQARIEAQGSDGQRKQVALMQGTMIPA